MKYPRPLGRIHQIEITSRCNLACIYCPHPKMERTKEDMTVPRFHRSMRWVQYFINRDDGIQTELALTGIGEATMHPDLVHFIRSARAVLGPARLLTFSTNGILLTDELLEELKPYNPSIYVSMHRPEVAIPAVERAKKHGLFLASNTAFVTSSLDWAGQVDWHVSAKPAICRYLLDGWGVVLADGRITTCCIDAEGDGVVGHIDDEPGSVSVQPFSLCEPCSLIVPKEEEIFYAGAEVAEALS